MKLNMILGSKFNYFFKQKLLGGSPGLVVMGDDSCSRGHGFESQHCILDEHDIFHIDLL